MNFDEINRAALSRYPQLLAEWLPNGHMRGREYECGDIQGLFGKSLKINIDSGRWADFAGDLKGGDPVSLYAAIHGLRQGEAAHELAQMLGVEAASNGNRRFANTPRSATYAKPLTLKELAEAKKLPIGWLREQGVTDFPDGGGVSIAYFDENKNQHSRLRKRTALRAKDGSSWLGPNDVALIAYGLWRLNDAREHARLVLVEGETDALTLWYHGVPALGIPGAAMGHTLSSKCLVGIQQIFVYHEPDAGGRTFVSKVASRLRELQFAGGAYEFSIDGVKDPSELHIDDPDAFSRRLTQALERAIPLVDVKNTDPARGEASQRDSQATQLVKFAHASGAQFFHDGEAAFASVRAEDHLETYALKSKGMRRWLTYLYFQSESKAPNADAIRCAIDTLAAYAQFKSEERKAYIRVGGLNGRLYLDLANSDWQVVEISSNGWKVIESQECPIRFRRAQGMSPLPAPARGGTINELRRFLNVRTDDDFRLVVGYLLGCYRDHGPYPVLILHGEQGSAKSTAARVLRELVDPNVAPIRSEPREPRDLMIAANNGWACAFDNLSHLPSWLSDALCRLSTGGGLSTRELYTDAEETIFEAERPIILTGIEELATRGDLLDRSIVQDLPRIDSKERVTEAEFYEGFRAARPRILGALLNAVASALAHVGDVRLDRLPRMADFATWVVAAEPALPWDSGAFIRAYTENQEAANEMTLEASPVAAAIRSLDSFEGTATELLAKLDDLINDKISALKTWPKSGRALANALRRLAPSLAAVGQEVTFVRPSRKTDGQRLIVIATRPVSTGDPSSPSSPSSPGEGNQAFSGDDSGDDGDDSRDVATPPATPKIPTKSDDGDGGVDGDANSPSLTDGSAPCIEQLDGLAVDEGWLESALEEGEERF